MRFQSGQMTQESVRCCCCCCWCPRNLQLFHRHFLSSFGAACGAEMGFGPSKIGDPRAVSTSNVLKYQPPPPPPQLLKQVLKQRLRRNLPRGFILVDYSANIFWNRDAIRAVRSTASNSNCWVDRIFQCFQEPNECDDARLPEPELSSDRDRRDRFACVALVPRAHPRRIRAGRIQRDGAQGHILSVAAGAQSQRNRRHLGPIRDLVSVSRLFDKNPSWVRTRGVRASYGVSTRYFRDHCLNITYFLNIQLI